MVDELIERNQTFLIKHFELVFNAHLHTEKLSHEIFYVLTALIIGTWTISNRSILLGDHQQVGKILLNLFAATLAAAGLLLTHRLRGSVEEAHVIMNRTREVLGLDDLEYENDKTIILDDWKKYTLKRIKCLFLIPRITAVKDENIEKMDTAREDDEPSGATGKYSWWAVYSGLYIVMFVISLLFVACAFYQ